MTPPVSDCTLPLLDGLRRTSQPRPGVRDCNEHVNSSSAHAVCVAPTQDPTVAFRSFSHFVARRSVNSVISGGQFKRIGTPMVPRPALV